MLHETQFNKGCYSLSHTLLKCNIVTFKIPIGLRGLFTNHVAKFLRFLTPSPQTYKHVHLMNPPPLKPHGLSPLKALILRTVHDLFMTT